MIHIGEKIKEFLNCSGMTITEFAEKINSSRTNVYDIFRRNSIDTMLLEKISEVLNYNLFNYYLTEKDNPLINELQKELEHSRQENQYLKKIILLLEEKK